MKIENQENKTVKKEVTKNSSASKEKNITLEQSIEVWKKSFGEIFKSEISGDIFIWRPIKRSEYKILLSSFEDLSQEEKMLAKQEEAVKMAILYPSNIDELIEKKAGLATVLSEEILANSGFDISNTVSL